MATNPRLSLHFLGAVGASLHLHRPAVIPVPSLALRILLGEMADDMLLASQRAVPVVARGGAFAWGFPELQAAMNDAVRRRPREG